jgi:CDP-glucose 4,6-dehydratase
VWLGQRPQIRSNGLYTRDYIYVQDVVDAYLALAEHCSEPGVRGEAFNFSPAARLTVLEIARTVQRLMNRPDLEPLVLDQAKGEIRDQYLDSTKAKERLGWSARYRLDDGLSETIAWYERFLRAATQPPVADACVSSTRT